MKEIERIITCQITIIEKYADNEVPPLELLNDRLKSELEAKIKRQNSADKVDIAGYKCFVHEPKPQEQA